MRTSEDRSSLTLFFVIAFAFSWSVEIPLALIRNSWIHLKIPFFIHYFAALGPALAAIIVSSMDPDYGIRKLLRGLFKWKVGWGWFIFSLFTPITLFGLSLLLADFKGENLNLSQLGRLDYLPGTNALGALIIWLLTFGLGEEIGWRGFVLPRLQKNRSALSASLIVGIIWAFWHLPLFFYRDAYTAMGLYTGFPLFLLSVLAASVVLTWLYNSTSGSLLMVILFHGMFNFFSASGVGGTNTASVMSAAIMVWAVVVIILYGPANLSVRKKQMIR